MNSNSSHDMTSGHAELRQIVPEFQAPTSLLQGLEARIKQYRGYLTAALPKESLLVALQHQQWEVRAAALECLSTRGEGMPSNLLELAMQDENCYVRMAAFRAASQMGPDRRLDLLRIGLHDRDWQVRELVVLLLGTERDPITAEVRAIILRDDNSNVREAAQQVLLQRGAENAAGLPAHPGSVSSSPTFLTVSGERKQTAMSLANFSTEPYSTPQSAILDPLTPPITVGSSTRKKMPRSLRLATLVALLVLMLGVFTAAGVGWWNTRFGNPNLYTAIDQQQTHQGVTIRITAVYADEGRTIIVYDTFSHDSTKQYFTDDMNLVGSAPQAPTALAGTYGNAPEQGLTRFYMIQPPFLVPAHVATLVLSLDIGSVIVSTPGTDSKSTTIMGPWHFSFSVPFHHQNITNLPNPFEGAPTRPPQ